MFIKLVRDRSEIEKQVTVGSYFIADRTMECTILGSPFGTVTLITREATLPYPRVVDNCLRNVGLQQISNNSQA